MPFTKPASSSARLAGILRQRLPSQAHHLAAQNFEFVGVRCRTSPSKAGLLVTDPLLVWGSTGTMGVRELLDSVDRAQAAGTSSNRALWERLGCRARALAPELLASEIARISFGFSRASVRDEELMESFFEVLLDSPEDARAWESMSVNDAALLLKAFSKQGVVDDKVFRLLLAFLVGHLEEATTADISQFLAATVRLGKTDDPEFLKPSGQGPKSILGLLLETANQRLDDAYLPASDITNLSVAAAKLPHTAESAAFLLKIVQRLQWESTTATIAPSDIVRRLRSLAVFEDGEANPRAIVDLSLEERRVILRVAGGAVSRRCQEFPPSMTVEALDAFRGLFRKKVNNVALEATPEEGSLVVDWSVLRPLCHLIIQRSNGLSGPARDQLHEVANDMRKLSGSSSTALPSSSGGDSEGRGPIEEESREPLLERLAALTARQGGSG